MPPTQKNIKKGGDDDNTDGNRDKNKSTCNNGGG